MTTKAKLIPLINERFHANLNNKNTSFSNINSGKNVWWLNIQTDKFKGNVHLLLKDDSRVIWIYLPKGFISSINSCFKIRPDKEVIDLEISSDKDYMYLKDIKSGGTNFNFEKFIRQIIEF